MHLLAKLLSQRKALAHLHKESRYLVAAQESRRPPLQAVQDTGFHCGCNRAKVSLERHNADLTSPAASVALLHRRNSSQEESSATCYSCRSREMREPRCRLTQSSRHWCSFSACRGISSADCTEVPFQFCETEEKLRVKSITNSANLNKRDGSKHKPWVCQDVHNSMAS